MEQRNTQLRRCQSSDRIEVLHDPVSQRQPPRRHRPARARVLPGLNVLTGETGAGKSILVEAVGLLVGGRASADLVRTGEETATVQAVFEKPDGGELIVRREVSAQGRSRAFIDDALATSGALRDAAGSLVDLHGQHEHQVLLDPAAHLDLLDAFAGLTDDRTAAGIAFREWQEVRDERARLACQRAAESIARRVPRVSAR